MDVDRQDLADQVRQVDNVSAFAKRTGLSRTAIYDFMDTPGNAAPETVKAIYGALSAMQFDVVRAQERRRVADWLRWLGDRVEEGELPGEDYAEDIPVLPVRPAVPDEEATGSDGSEE